MSGICAVWGQYSAEKVGETLASITAGLGLYPGEAIARKADEGAGVAIAARFSTQQIYANQRILIACDADLYNKDPDTRDSGPVPKNQKVAARLAGMYERFGCDFVERLRGAFSLVLWDRQERRLLAAVDGFGIHRLVYYEDGKQLLIGSRVDALARCREVDLSINPRAIANVLNFSANLAPATILEKVHRLRAGTMLIADKGQIRFKTFWDMRYGQVTETDEEELSHRLESVMEGSVTAQCAALPFAELGAFLSGGTDSSTVVGLMSRMGRGPVKTFSIGFEEQPFNELEYAKIAADRFHADHHVYLVGAKDCVAALPNIIRGFDEPYGNSSAIPTYFCARLAADAGVKTLLAGDGGDELFGGNSRYLTDKIFQLYQTVPRFVRKGLFEPALAVAPAKNGLVGKARAYVRRSNLPRLERYFSYHFLNAHSPSDVFQKDFLSSLGGYSALETPSAYYRNASAEDGLDRLLYVDFKVTLADNDLPKVTCMCDLAGIQARFPFLDRSVAEFSGCIPARLKVKGFEKRYLFKRAFRNLLPIEILKKKKHGFGIPVATWMKSDKAMREVARDLLLSARSAERGYFRKAFIEDLFRKHENEDTTYYGDTLWTFLALELWHRQKVDEVAGVTA